MAILVGTAIAWARLGAREHDARAVPVAFAGRRSAGPLPIADRLAR
jgi:hypothetical protein